MKPKQKNNSRKAIIFSLYMLPFMLNIALIEFLMPIKYDAVLDNLPFMGLLITIAWLMSTIFDFAIGDLTDRIGIRKTLQLGVLFSFAGAIIFGVSDNFLIMTLGIMLWGFSYTFLAIPSEAYILSKFKKDHPGSAYGWFFFFYDITYAFAPLVGLLIINFYGLDAAAIFIGIFVLLSFIFAFKIPGQSKQGIVDGIDGVIVRDGLFIKEWKDLFKMNKKEISILINMFVSGFWFTVVMIGAPLLFFHAKRDIVSGALLTFAFMLPLGLMELFTGKLADSHKRRMIMIKYGFLIGGMLLLAFFFIQQFWLLLVAAALITFAVNSAWTGSEVQISEYLPKTKKGEFMGIYMSAKDLGFDLAPLFYGLLTIVGLKFPFLIVGFMLLAAGIFFALTHRKE